MPGFCTAGPGAVLFVEAVVFIRAWRSVLAAVQHAVPIFLFLAPLITAQFHTVYP